MYIVASNVWGPMVIVLDPSLCIVFRSGLFASPSVPFFFDGFVQYLAKIPSASHLTRERCRAAARTAESATVWYSFVDNLDGCGLCEVGKGLLSSIFVGRPSLMVGVDIRCVGVASGKDFRFVYLAATGFGVGFAGVDFLGVDADFVAKEAGDDASLFVTDSRRSRAGRTRFCGMEDCDALACGKGDCSAIAASIKKPSAKLHEER